MKKKKKIKKKRRSIAWKLLEKYVANRFNGKRINRALDYSKSLPDVVLDGSIIGIPNSNIVVECKHSQNQPFIDLLKPLLVDSQFICIEDYVFWNLEKLNSVLLFGTNIATTKEVDYTIPKYIHDNYTQASNYSLDKIKEMNLITNSKVVLCVVVIAKKNSSLRIAYTKRNSLKECQPLLIPSV